MPLPWSAYAIARTTGVLAVTFFAGSALTNAAASRLLVSDDALANVERIEIDRTPPSSDADLDPKQAKRVELLDAALATSKTDRRRELGERIVDNNVFCPACQPSLAVEQDEGAPVKPAMTPTELPLALLATMESDDPLFSLATIEDTERSVTGVFALNEAIRPGVFVAAITRGNVVLRTEQGTETLGLLDTRKPKKKPKAKPKKKKKPKKGKREIAGARDAIECKGNACTVDRKFVNKLMANPQLLMRQAKFIPAVKDGETRGFRVHRVLHGTLPKLLGLKNGDTLLAVNGAELDSMDRAMSLYTKLRRASELSLTVERKGKVFEKQISIR